ncbi:hypothetical protein J7I98_37450, partial [Streptomyces sp. ISL-98]|uniref:hypothetical protein n=1 Tax=Streptomyces sp. ISL-98 TaxID=2819192 RepID=UPI001BE74584
YAVRALEDPDDEPHLSPEVAALVRDLGARVAKEMSGELSDDRSGATIATPEEQAAIEDAQMMAAVEGGGTIRQQPAAEVPGGWPGSALGPARAGRRLRPGED